VRLTLLGAGLRVPFVLRGLSGRRDLGLTEVVLHDTDPDRLATMGAIGAHLTTTWGAPFTVRADTDARGALTGAAFVYAAIRPGQEEGRVADEEIPLALGVLGQETTGPGGFAMAMRTIPAMLAHARLIEEVAPEAWLICFTNPVGIVVQAVHDATDVRVVGVCDTPASMHRSIAAFLGRSPQEVRADYAGLNHCGWIHRVLVDDEDRMPDLLARFEDLQRADPHWQPFDPARVRATGMLPNEYLAFYDDPEGAVRNIGASGGTRARQLHDLHATLWPLLHERVAVGDPDGAVTAWEAAVAERGATYLARETGAGPRGGHADVFDDEGYHGVAAAVIAAVRGDRAARLVLDTENHGAIAGLHDDDVVEVSATVDRAGVRSLPQGDLPGSALDLLGRVKAYERLTVEAAVGGSLATAREALATHPLVGSSELATRLLERYLTAHAGRWPALT
jgi:6-phospho-beta-glucosidase